MNDDSLLIDPVNKTIKLNGEEVKLTSDLVQVKDDLAIARPKKDQLLLNVGSFRFSFTLVSCSIFEMMLISFLEFQRT